MGFFSWDCKGCNEAILSPWSVNQTNRWRAYAIATKQDGSTVKGLYDGYGRIDVNCIYTPQNCLKLEGTLAKLYCVPLRNLSRVELTRAAPAIWHVLCYNAASTKERKDVTPSSDAICQGYFFNHSQEGAYNSPAPGQPGMHQEPAYWTGELDATDKLFVSWLTEFTARIDGGDLL